MKQKELSNIKWIVKVIIITFILSGIISYISQNGIDHLNVISAIVVLIIVVFLGIFFDIVGIAVTVANEEHFHAKATKKAEGAKSSLSLIKNASKVANFCADVIGDICGVISGAIGTMIALKISNTYGISNNIQYLVSALVASITVGGKAFGKEIATNNSTKIVDKVGIVLSKFTKND